MSEFKREARYIVIKTSDLAKVPTAYRSDLVDPLSRLQAHLPNRDFVVVESDWPEYEPVWQMIEARMNGEPTALDAALAREAALREELANHDSASQLMNAWVAEKGPMPWVTAINVMAIATNMPDAERKRLLDMDDGSAELNTLQQRLTDAEKRVAELDSAARETLRIAGIANQGSNAYNRAIINLNSVLKLVEG